VAPGAFATLQRRGPQGRAHIWGCVFVQRRQKRRKARPEGPSRCFGYCSFVEERRSRGEARRAEPTSAFLVASDQKRQILALAVAPYGASKGSNTSHCRRLSSLEPYLSSKPYYHLLVRLYCAQRIENR